MDTNIIQSPSLLHVLSTATQSREITLQLLSLLQSDPNISSSAKLSKNLLSSLSLLRARYRTAVLFSRDNKSQTTLSKNEIDTLHLNLQNLVYEQKHLRGEIADCQDFQHRYTSLGLISEQEFLEKIDTKEAVGDGHGLMVLRIEDELHERKRLLKIRNGLVERKMELVKRNLKRKEELEGLDKDVQHWLDGAKKVEKTIEEYFNK